MAKSNIEIEITANLKDNATDKAKTVNKELDKLEKRSVNVDITATDKASKVMDSIDSKLRKVDGSKTATDIDRVVDKANAAVDGVSQVKLTADTSNVDKAIDGIKKKLMILRCLKLSLEKNHLHRFIKELLLIWINGIVRQAMQMNMG